jgi:hypothetical protein
MSIASSKGRSRVSFAVQAPVKLDLVIQPQNGQRLGLTIPSSLLATANEVIE